MGCSHSTSRSNASASPYLPTSAAVATTSSTRALPLSVPSPRTSSHAPTLTQTQSRSRRTLAPGEHLNAPLRPHTWNSSSKRTWTPSQLLKERTEFFDTRVTGHAEIWGSLRLVTDLLRAGEVESAQGILDAAAITVPTGDL
ncbi:MAG: hypothetical protein Q9222_003827, partial [Ikaeria aurantiellina]